MKYIRSKVSFRPKGFTLIELLVVAGLFVTISTIILSIFVIALRGTKKSENILVLKQNGNFAMSQVVKQIRYAKSVDSPASCVPSTTQSSITITSLDNGQSTFSCQTIPNSTIASNTASLMDTNKVRVTSCSFTCSQPNALEPPTITISFTLLPKNVSVLAENTGAVPFSTSVTMRNFTR